MAIIYHRVPSSMIGDTLYPMNRLMEVDARLYNSFRKGYEDRKNIHEKMIPYIDCLWNDAIHLSPVHPSEIDKALQEAGLPPLPTSEYFEIDTERNVDPTNCVVFFPNSEDPNDFTYERLHNVKSWDGEVAIIPEVTKKYYRHVATSHEPLFAYYGIPHVLYKGIIHTSELSRFRV
jgi:hypothetical protein